VLHPAMPGLQPQQYPWKMARSAEGLTHIGIGQQSLISDPRNQRTILLDHANKLARIIPQMPAPPSMPGMPSLPGQPSIPGVPPIASAADVKNLGKQMILGHEAEGKLYSVPVPAPPKLPGMPSLPTSPLQAASNLPRPNLPQPNVSAVEVWTSTQLHVPLLTKINGPAGQTIATCTKATPCNPPPSFFQIPPDYKVVE
jgi:hypothetical protein